MPTIAAATRDIVADVSPDEVDLVPTATQAFYDNPASRHAIVHGIVRGTGRDAALGFGAIEVGQLVASIVIIVLNGVAANVLAGMTERKLTRFGRWLAKRRLARRLATPAPAGSATPLPKLTPTEADAVAGLVRELARTSGLPAEAGARLAIVVAAKLLDSSEQLAADDR